MRYAALWLLLLAAGSARAGPVDAPNSIYELKVQLTNQSGVVHGLDVHRGHTVLVTMFYGSCPAACPTLIDTLRAVEHAAGAEQRSELRVLMISIDPERDTVQSLQELAKTRRIDLSRWTVAHADAATVRNVAAVLNVQYRKLPDGDFNHSSIITVLDARGAITQQSAVLGKADPALMAALARSVADR